MLGDGTAATVRSAASSSFASSTALVISSSGASCWNPKTGKVVGSGDD